MMVSISAKESVPALPVHGPGLAPPLNGHPAVLQEGSVSVKPVQQSVSQSDLCLIHHLLGQESL